MASHHQMDPYLRQSLEMMGLPSIMPEPEVVHATLAGVRSRSLAAVVAKLINENEPMLCASAEGATVIVREKGDSSPMRFTVEA